MAENSIREQIIINVVDTLSDLSTISTVVRKKLSNTDQLLSIPVTQLPYISIIGKLPVPTQKKSGRRPGGVQVITSVMDIEIFCYQFAPEFPDESISSLLDDIWSNLYSDQLRSGLAQSTELLPTAETIFMDPYVMFQLICRVAYIHNTLHI